MQIKPTETMNDGWRKLRDGVLEDLGPKNKQLAYCAFFAGCYFLFQQFKGLDPTTAMAWMEQWEDELQRFEARLEDSRDDLLADCLTDFQVKGHA